MTAANNHFKIITQAFIVLINQHIYLVLKFKKKNSINCYMLIFESQTAAQNPKVFNFK